MFRLSHVDLDEARALRARASRPDAHVAARRANARRRLTAVAGLYELWQRARADGIVDVPRELVSFFISPYPDEVTVNMTRVVDIDPLDPDDLTRAEVEARLQAMQLLAFFRAARAGLRKRAHRRDRNADRHSRVAPHRRPLHADARRRAASAHVRRRGRAQRVSDRHPQPAGQRNDDAAARAGRELRDSVSRLVPVNREQLLVAGRCISTTHEALASTRLTPTVMTLGQAAGTAAALAARAACASATSTRARCARSSSPTASLPCAGALTRMRRARYGIAVRFADLGDWGRDELRSEYDPAGRRFAEHPRRRNSSRRAELGEFVALAVGTNSIIIANASARFRCSPIAPRANRRRSTFARGLLERPA